MKIKNILQKILSILLFNLLMIPFSNGQAALIVLILGDKVATEQFHLSIDAGLNLSNYHGFDQEKTGLGVNFGLGTHIKLGEKWHLKPEFKPLSRKVAKDVRSITSVPSELTVDENKIIINYIDVPVYLQYNVTPKFFVSAGPQISFRTGADQFSSGTLTDGTESTSKINIKSSFNNINLSFPLEAGYLIGIATKRSTTKMDINVFIRYEYGFLEVFKDPAVGSAKISLFQVGASLPFIKTEEELANSKK
jgi:hypothetical protein